MIIDEHRHIVGDYQPILTEMDALRIARTVLVGVGVRNLNVVTIRDSIVFRYHFLFRSLGSSKSDNWLTRPIFVIIFSNRPTMQMFFEQFRNDLTDFPGLLF
ncbi:MAG: hypothetical protein ACXWT3_09040 [Methylococcaceae bacterium]